MKYLFFLMLFFSGCSLKKETEITSEYIINQNWSKNRDRAGGNSIQIVKLKVKKDSLISPFKNLDQAELLTKLEHDSTFIYSANIKIGAEESYSEKKYILIRIMVFIGGQILEIAKQKQLVD